jgi:hypothetical protein
MRGAERSQCQGSGGGCGERGTQSWDQFGPPGQQVDGPAGALTVCCRVSLSIIASNDAIEKCRGKPGIKQVFELTKRDKMLRWFRVSPTLIRYSYLQSPFRLQNLAAGAEVNYIMYRGAFDDFWQRSRPAGEPKGPPTLASAKLSRGYLEVEL